MTASIDRRRFLLSLPALAIAPKALLQPRAAAPLAITSFNHVSLNVTDLKRSIDFYQGLFGMPIQSRQGAASVELRIGAGPQFLNLAGGATTAARGSNAFYRQLFGMGYRSYQGPTAPTLAIGPGVDFLMFTGGGAGRAGANPAPARPASINHFCMNLEKFDADRILKTLDS